MITYREIARLREALTKELIAEVSPMPVTTQDKLLVEARLQTVLSAAVSSLVDEVEEIAEEKAEAKK